MIGSCSHSSFLYLDTKLNYDINIRVGLHVDSDRIILYEIARIHIHLQILGTGGVKW